MENYDLDLDTVLPAGKTIKLNGQVATVYPPKLRTMLKITAAAKKMELGDINEGMPEMIDALAEVVPVLKDPNVDISVDQLLALTQFIGTMSTPPAVTTETPEADDEVKKNLETPL